MKDKSLKVILSIFFSLGLIGCGSEDASTLSSGVKGDSSSKSFVSLWRTTTATEAITLPLRSGYQYDFVVDWGDGSSTDHILSFSDIAKTHTYTLAGDYTITITGEAEAWYFNNTGDKDKIINVSEFGSLGWIDLNSAFYGCSNLESFSGGDTSLVTDMRYIFGYTTSLTSLDVSSFDTSNVTDMSRMFSGVSALTSLDVSNFNTSRVVDMSHMFAGAQLITHFDLLNFDTANVTLMSSMFELCFSAISINLSSFDTSSVIWMNAMFFAAGSVTNLDLSGFNMSAVTNVTWMFHSTYLLTSLDASNWNVASVISSTDFLKNKNAGLVVTCDQDAGPGLGTLFGETCN